MEISEYIAVLRTEGETFAATAERTALDAQVPACPGWRMRDLLRHLGGVHRWATAYVAERRAEMMSADEEERVTTPCADDAALVDWFREGHRRLIDALESAPPDLDCWTFLPAPSPLAFWARRQAHETAVHRADAQSASTGVTPFPPAVAADGIDELVSCFLTRPRGRLRSGPPRTLHVHADDTGGDWLIRIGVSGRSG